MNVPFPKRDHGGGLDAAAAEYGGDLEAWLDLSTGINPNAYPVGQLPQDIWGRLPDEGAMARLLDAARSFWSVPDGVEVIAAAGASPLIARMPDMTAFSGAYIPVPTYNEYAAAFAARGRLNDPLNPQNPVHVYVHPNNPDGRMWPGSVIGGRPLTIIDESFCDTVPDKTHMARAAEPGVIILKSFGKFWGLAGLRLGFAIAAPETFARSSSSASLQELMGPWSVSGPALEIGARALQDHAWAEATRVRLGHDAARLDDMLLSAGAEIVGGTTLFRTYAWEQGAEVWQKRLAEHRIWSRIFPYSTNWMRLGLPATDEDWARLDAAL
ncbi:threonine-phosphate decarboxylase [Jannaschia sp. CCS1]|uniref:threonine-phosphate decarboxylase n=1 Tax=Jannaschia sp. (strain CCS1) TaxID=290400 RepID=UPI000053CFF1|nr:threonine-phosphate decarboxylase [Jannaschia sp. CCS1]ABD53286.1 aminotransferase [Jannaschia sp. CCS1]